MSSTIGIDGIETSIMYKQDSFHIL